MCIKLPIDCLLNSGDKSLSFSFNHRNDNSLPYQVGYIFSDWLNLGAIAISG